MDKLAKIYVAGHGGLVGSALCKVLQQKGYTNLIYRTHAELDLTDQKAVEAFFAKEKPRNRSRSHRKYLRLPNTSG